MHEIKYCACMQSKSDYRFETVNHYKLHFVVCCTVYSFKKCFTVYNLFMVLKRKHDFMCLFKLINESK